MTLDKDLLKERLAALKTSELIVALATAVAHGDRVLELLLPPEVVIAFCDGPREPYEQAIATVMITVAEEIDSRIPGSR